MKVSLILAHPDPRSLNHAIADRARATLRAGGHDVSYHDLCAEGFDPVMPAAEIPSDAVPPAAVGRQGAEIRAADGIIIVHPNWWGQPPAILTGWIDRVLRPGMAYRFREGDQGEGVPEGLLRARIALVFNTANTSERREADVFGDPLDTIWRNCVLGLCGVRTIHRRTFQIVVTSTAEQRRSWLDEVEAAVRLNFPPAA
jgi:putative NADPH-quinone reductase